MFSAPRHQPVLLSAVLERAHGAARIVDATLGDGGHAEALRAPGAELLAIDRDPDAIQIAQARIGNDRVQYLTADFSSDTALDAVAAFHPQFILLDLGVSSRQLDQDDRGFTFRPGARLDMRMGEGMDASEWLAATDEATLRAVLRDAADEPRAARLAREIVRRRARRPMASSDDLVGAIRAILGPTSGPAEFARIFQGIRIAVNGEFDALERALPTLRDALDDGGTLAVISYHSGEDRRVKQAFRAWERGCRCPPEFPVCICGQRPLGRADPRRAIVPLAAEVARNPRSRSAKLRFFRVHHAR